jgi:hypothetical protein
VETRECRLIFLLKRSGKQKARDLKKKAATIPKMGKRKESLVTFRALGGGGPPAED